MIRGSPPPATASQRRTATRQHNIQQQYSTAHTDAAQHRTSNGQESLNSSQEQNNGRRAPQDTVHTYYLVRTCCSQCKVHTCKGRTARTGQQPTQPRVASSSVQQQPVHVLAPNRRLNTWTTRGNWLSISRSTTSTRLQTPAHRLPARPAILLPSPSHHPIPHAHAPFPTSLVLSAFDYNHHVQLVSCQRLFSEQSLCLFRF